jgi:CspA family cold shock protein
MTLVLHRPGMCPGEIPMPQEKHMATGTVKFFNATKGFGFISPEGGAKDVFVHATAVEAAGLRSLAEGQRVTFDIQPDARGAKAVNLKAA